MRLQEALDLLAEDLVLAQREPARAERRVVVGFFGVGHGCFLRARGGDDELDWWHLYHAKDDRADGWRRSVFLQPVRWQPDGWPDLGSPVARGVPLPLPRGERAACTTGQSTRAEEGEASVQVEVEAGGSTRVRGP